jgi:hypothetical protein
MLTSPGTRSPSGRKSYVRTRRNSRAPEEVQEIEEIEDGNVQKMQFAKLHQKMFQFQNLLCEIDENLQPPNL